MSLLEKTRQISSLMQKGNGLDFEEITELLKDLVNANVYIILLDGKLQSYALCHEYECDIMKEKVFDKGIFPKDYVANIKKIRSTKANIPHEENNCTFVKGSKCMFLGKTSTVIPIYGSGKRMGTLVCVKYDDTFDEEDVLVAEYAATVIGVSILNDMIIKQAEDVRKKAMIDVALSTLSYTETEAVKAILSELDGDEGILVASKIADSAGITRSVIVNSMRKFESAGLIKTQSLGMKGTHIAITNDALLDELNKRFGIYNK